MKTMNLIAECDIGRDPDDFFAVCYLVAAGVNIRAITVSPGDPDQIAVAKFLCEELGLDIPVAAGKKNRNDSSSGGVHYKILKNTAFHYGRIPMALVERLSSLPCNRFLIANCSPLVLSPA